VLRSHVAMLVTRGIVPTTRFESVFRVRSSLKRTRCMCARPNPLNDYKHTPTQPRLHYEETLTDERQAESRQTKKRSTCLSSTKSPQQKRRTTGRA
jgi:hypothetical protein